MLLPSDALGRKGKLTPTTSTGLRLVCLRRCRSTDQALARLEANGIKPDVVYRTDDSGTLLRPCARAQPPRCCRSCSSNDAHDLVARTLSSPQLFRRIGIAWRREQPPADAGAEFVAIVRDVLAARDRRIARASCRPQSKSPDHAFCWLSGGRRR